MTRLAHGEVIDLSRQIFERIHYKATIVTLDNLPYEMIITKLLLDKEVQPQAKEWQMDQIGPLDITYCCWSIDSGRQQTVPIQDLVHST